MRVIEEGIKHVDWIIVKGLQRVRSGSKVSAEKIEMASLQVSARKTKQESMPDKTAMETTESDVK